jgi:hypothetical protein
MTLVQPGMVYVMGIDGGGTTGWGIIGVERASIFGPEKSAIRHFKHGQVTGSYTEQVLTLLQIIKTYHNPYYTLALAVESFSPRKPITSEEFFAPLEINARLQFLVDTHKIHSPLFYQTPSFALSTASDKRLKRWGLYTPGPDHVKDGTRHAISFIRRCKADNDLAAKAWPLAIEQPRYPISQIIRNKSHP